MQEQGRGGGPEEDPAGEASLPPTWQDFTHLDLNLRSARRTAEPLQEAHSQKHLGQELVGPKADKLGKT